MPSQQPLKNFIKSASGFLSELEKNNNREWFNAHKDEFEELVMRPAQEFVFLMGQQLQAVVPGIIADPKVNRSIFRLNRDTRFSSDKTPYKTNLGIYFWEGKQNRLETSGFYFHIEPKLFMLGVGMYMFSKEQLQNFREAITDPDEGKVFRSIVGKLSKKYAFGDIHYKKYPKDFPKDHVNAEFLLYNGFYCYHSRKDMNALNGENIIPYSFKIFRDMAPLHQWLIRVMRD